MDCAHRPDLCLGLTREDPRRSRLFGSQFAGLTMMTGVLSVHMHKVAESRCRECCQATSPGSIRRWCVGGRGWASATVCKGLAQFLAFESTKMRWQRGCL